MRLRTTVFFLAGLMCTLSVAAQTAPGNIIGVVRDESGAVLPGVSATLTSPALPGGPVSLVTNAQGEYRFTGLQSGVYALTVTLAGFSTYREEDLRVTVGGTAERNIALKVAPVAETITVSGQAPVIDARQTGITQALPVEVVENVPHKRYGVQSFMATMPGVNTSNYNSPFNVYVMGSNANETSFMFDGVMTNHPTTGNAWSLSDFDGLEEVNVVTLGASAEYQQAQGGVLNAVGKSGTNRFQADVSAFWGPDALSSKPVQLPCNCPDGETGFTWYKYRDVSTHVGGPIVTNHAWFFGGLVFRGKLATTPGQAPPPPADQYLSYIEDANIKGTWKISDRMTFRQTYYHERFMETLPNFPTLTQPIETLQRSSGLLPHTGSELVTTLSNNTVLSVRYALTNIPDKRIGFYNDLTTPARFDSFTGVSSKNAVATRTMPRRDEADVKVNTYRAGARVSQNVSFGVQLARNRTINYDVQPGGVVYSDLNGAPDQATFTPPSVQAAKYNAQGVWGEDEVTVGRRLTLKFGARLDRMQAISQDAPAIDSQFTETGATIAGLGKMFTWTTLSPRAGLNFKLTKDDKTVLRATAGRYFRPIFLNDFTIVHPGTAISTLARYNPATAAYDRIVSVTDPRANIAVDPDMKAPFTDQYSIGIDREVARNVALSVSYVIKESRDQIGWIDIGGIYGTSTATASTGETVTTHPLLNSPSVRKYLRTNGPGFFSSYNGLILSLTRRYANRWMATAGYSYSVTEGLQPGGNTGRDPNDLVNLSGRLDPQDRPHAFTLLGSYEVPKIEVQVSGNLAFVQGTPYAPQVQINLPQGRRSINADVPGSYRTPNESFLQMRFTKILFRTDHRRVEVTGELRNALQELDSRSIITRVLGSANFGKPASWPDPRQLMLLTKVYF
jgi:hypothetical protein